MKNKKLAPLFLVFLVPYLVVSCAALTRYKCNRDYATKKGMEDASAGLISQPAKTDGVGCESPYSESNFVFDYQKGFEQKRAEVCQRATGAAYGQTDGAAGLASQPQRQKLGLCSTAKDFKHILADYDGAFTKAFCSADRAAKLGAAQGAAVEANSFDSAFAVCKQKHSLRRAYMAAYKSGLANFCTESQAQALGASMAAQKRAKEESAPKFALCASLTPADLSGAFARSYDETMARLGQEEAARAAQAQAQARTAKADEFQRTTAVSTFSFRQRPHVSRCSVAPDRAYAQVEVENPYADQVLIQGRWKMQYYNSDFAKITEDSTEEAVLVSGNTKKAFQKLSLPRDAAFCRAEFTSPAAGYLKRLKI